jgi:stage II sporulation SpoE-like protein
MYAPNLRGQGDSVGVNVWLRTRHRLRIDGLRSLAAAVVVGACCALVLGPVAPALAKHRQEGNQGQEQEAGNGGSEQQHGNGRHHGHSSESQPAEEPPREEAPNRGSEQGSGEHGHGHGSGEHGGGSNEHSPEAVTSESAVTPQSNTAGGGSHARGSSGRGSAAVASSAPTPSAPSASSSGTSSTLRSGPPAPSSPIAPLAPISVTPTPVAPATKAAAKTPTRAHTHRSRSGQRGTRLGAASHRGATELSLPAGFAASGAPTGTTAASAPGADRRRLPAKAPQAAPSRLAPLVKTITRIVGVIPMPVRMLLVALLALALALAVRSRLMAMRARRLERQRAALADDVGLLQAALLPEVASRLGPVATSVAYRPAEGPAAGGDFYDVFALEAGQLAVIVGDLSGHGRQALPHTALVRFTLRAHLEAGQSPREALRTTGMALDRQLGDFFATIAAAVYDPRERTLTYACAGHPPPVVLGSGLLEPIPVFAPPVGAGMRTGTRQTVVSLPGFSKVCFYTDGLTEARVGSELLGFARLAGIVGELGDGATASDLLNRVAHEADACPDDMAACLLTVSGDPAPAVVLAEQLELDSSSSEDRERVERFLLACGVPPERIGKLVLAARADARSMGSVLLEVRCSYDPPQVTLRGGNVTTLPLPPARATAAMAGASA